MRTFTGVTVYAPLEHPEKLAEAYMPGYTADLVARAGSMYG